jgi:hypothetical protein
MVKNLFTVITLAFLFGSVSLLPIHAQTSSNYELSGGWWFDGKEFLRQKLYVINGVFQKQRPARVDEIIKLDDLYIVVMWSQTTPRLIFPKRKLGRLSPHYEASLLALSCNPLNDFACTRKITLRMKQGQIM